MSEELELEDQVEEPASDEISTKASLHSAKNLRRKVRDLIDGTQKELEGVKIKGRTITEWYDVCSVDMKDLMTPVELAKANAQMTRMLEEVGANLQSAKFASQMLGSSLDTQRSVRLNNKMKSAELQKKKTPLNRLAEQVEAELVNESAAVELTKFEVNFWQDLYNHLKLMLDQVKQYGILITSEAKYGRSSL